MYLQLSDGCVIFWSINIVSGMASSFRGKSKEMLGFSLEDRLQGASIPKVVPGEQWKKTVV